MSTSLHHPTRPWSAATTDTARPTDPLASVGVALRALVPGRAAEDVVPAVHAADAQALLRRAGTLDPHHRTARWDRPTTDAVAAFQRARHLPATGIADRRTADLLLGPPTR
jgi:hypothetical protein